MDGQLTPLAVSVAEAQRILGGISRTAVYELARDGQLKKIRIGRRGLITVASISAFVDRLAQTQPCVGNEQPLIRQYTDQVSDNAQDFDIAHALRSQDDMRCASGRDELERAYPGTSREGRSDTVGDDSAV
jgi:hypothetical protein